MQPGPSAATKPVRGALRVLAWLSAALFGAIAPVAAQSPPPIPARDLHETTDHVAVAVQDLRGRSEVSRIPITWYRPPGAGPFPLAVVSHGRDAPEQRRRMGRARFETLARYLVAKGFAVAVPTRVGYGETFGDFDPENTGGCAVMRVDAVADAAAEQVLAAVEHARTLPWVDTSRWIAVGQSVGGLATLAAAARAPAGLVAAINFSGGAGGNPHFRPGNPCSPQQIERLWRSRGGLATAPTLWVYWRNDRYWGAEWPQRWLRAWTDAGGQARLLHLPEVGTDGHVGLSRDMDRWVPLVDAWLAPLGFGRPGMPPRPPASGFAPLADIERVPLPATTRESYYRRFLAAERPRAFAIGPHGQLGWASGDWAVGRALGYCQRARGERCTLYAVDDDVVWGGTQPGGDRAAE